MTATDELRIEPTTYLAVVTEVLTNLGVTTEDAEIQARLLLEGDLHGHSSHGVRRLAVLVGRFRAGLITTGLGVGVDWCTPTFAAVDGRSGFGAVVAGEAVQLVTERAASTGMAFAAIRNANHVGMLAPYIERIAGGGQIGLALTTSEALVHPWGGSRAMVGTNPIGIAVPSAAEPLVLDMSTASVSMGKILDHKERGLEIPLGWAVDAAGTATTDPAAASVGAISPFGGPKGYALGVALEALVAALTGTALGTAKTGTLDVTLPSTKGDVFVALDVERLGLTGSLEPLAAYFDELRGESVDPTRPVTIPGDRSRQLRAELLEHGIPLHPKMWSEVMGLLHETREELHHA
ncbi:Ldh family oxidoreductase [Nocardioides sp. DS6]|uniref:Ldh family oxidoreductase n=1 Tax=Nocardioides eburneus TaxID=3231482 RepID=A0ABV3T0A5_9ACTN